MPFLRERWALCWVLVLGRGGASPPAKAALHSAGPAVGTQHSRDRASPDSCTPAASRSHTRSSPTSTRSPQHLRLRQDPGRTVSSEPVHGALGL